MRWMAGILGLLAVLPVVAEEKPKKLILIAGRASHGPGLHEFNAGCLLFRKIVLNAMLWITKMEVPEGGVESTLTEGDMAANLDVKGEK